MIISHRHKFVFFSFPKTGSESVRTLLAPYNEVAIAPWRSRTPFYPHMPPVEVAEAFAQKGWDFDSYRRITCVRNPYTRLVSLYRMIRQVDGFWRLGLRPDFARWLGRIRVEGRGGGGRQHQRWRRFGTWSAQHWTRNANGHNLVDDILRLEDLSTTLPPLLDQLGLPAAPLPHLNQRAGSDWTDWYTPKTRQRVTQLYAWDFTHLGYNF